MIQEYEKRMLEDTKSVSFVLITSFGINVSNVINFTISSFLNKFSLAFLVNFEEFDLSLFNGNEYFRNVQNLDKPTRNRLYKKCGVFVSTPRLILTDFLESNLDLTKLSCIIVNDAHRLIENSLEAFILYLYAKKCPDYSIKAFSTNCIPFSYGTNSLEKKISALRTTNIVLYPRFHESLKASFTNSIQFTEHKLKMDANLVELQMILLEMLKEVVRPLTKRHGITYDFLLMANQFSVCENLKDSTILYDIKDLKFLINLVQSGSQFLFYYEASKLIQKQINLKSKSTWINCTSAFLFIEALDSLLSRINEVLTISDEGKDVAKLFKEHEKHKKIVKLQQEHINNNELVSNRTDDLNYPSYTTFYDRNAIKEYNKSAESDSMYLLFNKKFKALIEFIDAYKKTTIIVVCSKAIIKKDLMFQLELMQVKYSNVEFYSQTEFIRLSYWSKGFRQFYTSDDCEEFKASISEAKELEDIYSYSPREKQPKRFKSLFNDDLKGQVDVKIVPYDLTLEVLRYCEYLGNTKNITVDAFSFKDSLEEEKFLTSTRKEKEYFEQLIEKRSKLPIFLDDNCDILEDEDSFEEGDEYQVVVDSRELRAELVFMLYKAGNKITVSTIPIGDYQLSDDICIERKSIPDLISSFNSGRLYTQSLHLSHNYSKPFLLLEFIGRPCLSDYCNITSDGFRNSLVSKLIILLISFPNIKLIWSSSIIYSVRAFRILQKQTTTTTNEPSNNIDPNLLEILLSVPGITQFNLHKITEKFTNLKMLISSDLQCLVSVLGENNGTKVFNFFNDKI